MAKVKDKFRQIRIAPTLGLIIRMNCLHAESEHQPKDAGVPIADIREATAIFKEIKRRHGRLAALFYAGGK